ncbi:MAG: ABC transporter ATP-binding protein [Nitrosomonadales bacterium]|nr:ABC transporter ATP-binding protein [Nitrosomonadales bacterium]|tara:strand:- start:1131 stop:1931 length:801 start_codon:yes stop_codon:yes gene_type:complete
MEILLEAKNLSKNYVKTSGFFTRTESVIKALDNISINIKKGITLAVVGESGSGKSTLAKSLIRLIDLDNGLINFQKKNLTILSGEELKKIKKNIQMIFQDPYASLNPRMKILKIMEEPLKIHDLGDNATQYSKIVNMIKKVGLSEDDLTKYPHQFSGGQRQRIGIARALILEPELVICDEPVSALDVSVQAQIVQLLKSLQKEFGLTYLFITHDLRIVRHIANEVIVMKDGKLIEQGKTDIIFNNPKTNYTKELLASIPGNLSKRK